MTNFSFTFFLKAPLLFIPFYLADFQYDPFDAYLVLWVGSLFIYFASTSGFIVPLPNDLPWYKQLFRPIFFTNTLFIGFTVFSTIFYFLDQNGFIFFTKLAGLTYAEDDLWYLVACQKVYNLGHASYVLGLLVFSKYKTNINKINVKNETKLVFYLSVGLIIISQIFFMISFLNQLGVKLFFLGYVAIIVTLGLAKKNGDNRVFNIGLFIYFILLVRSLFTGRKEDSIILIILFGIVLYPYYRKLFTVFGPIVILLWFYFVPIFANTLRHFLWYEGQEQIESIQTTVDELNERSELEIEDMRWKFLVDRFSEVKMFEVLMKFKESTDKDYFGEIIGNTFISLIPRVFWAEKPETEYLAMARVYEVGIVEEGGGTSAKTKYMVDSYLVGGYTTVIFFMFLLGMLTALGSVYAEYLFGGYFWGTAIMFTGLFNILWTGNSFEFMFNAILYSFILMYLFFQLGKTIGVIQRIK